MQKTYDNSKSDSHLPRKPSRKLFYLIQSRSFNNDEKFFLSNLKSSFRSQGIYIFVLTFCSCRKNSLIRKLRLISKFMMSQPG